MKYFICCILFILSSLILLPQSVNIYTPMGSLVPDTYIVEESLTPADIVYMNSKLTIQYPNAQKLEEATSTYNCHAYAWHISEGGNRVWIGYYTATAEDIYWQDGSYIEVTNPIKGDKVVYVNDNHSAVTTSENGIVISKWGQWPLLKHSIYDSPYISTSIKYYRRSVPKFAITGSSTICDIENYDITYSPNGSIIEWTTSPNIVIVSGQGTASIIASKASSAEFGKGYINVKIKLNGHIVLTANKVIDYVGTPVATSVTGPSYLSVDGTGNFIAEPYINSSDILYKWIVVPSTVSTNPWNNSNSITFHAEGTYSVSCQIISPCGFGSAANTIVTVSRSGYFTLFPNPATDIVTIDIVGKENNDYVDEPISFGSQLYKIEIWNEFVMIKQFTTDQRASQVSVSDLPAGEYVVKVNSGGKVYTQTFIKK